MEIFELRYFLSVARRENIHRAAQDTGVSPASLSKAIGRLEDEMGIRLFSRERRHIRLTPSGRLLQQRASEIVGLEEATKVELTGSKSTLHVTISGSEVLASYIGLALVERIQKRFAQTKFEFRTVNDHEAAQEVLRGDAHLGIIAGAVRRGLQALEMVEAPFATYVGPGHPLYRKAERKQTLPIEAVLQYDFVQLTEDIFGPTGKGEALDGWREDKFPRRVSYQVSSLKLLEKLVAGGKAIAYLPDYFAADLNLQSLKISGCPYSCKQRIKFVCRSGRSPGWVNQVF